MARGTDNSNQGDIHALAVVIARGGSKGLLKKNLRPLGGKPLVAWTIEHALASGRINAVALSSDDQEILTVGRSHHVDVFERPAELAHDRATVDAAARHGVESWEKQCGVQCQYVAILYGNIALRPADLTDRAIDKLTQTGADSVQSVYRVETAHPYWMRKLVGDGGDQLEPWQPNEVYRRQDLPLVYMLNSGVLAVTRASLFDVDEKHPHQFLGRDRRAVVTGQHEVIDIDSELDLRLASALLAQHPPREDR